LQSLDPADGGGEITAQPHWVSVILFYLLHVCFVLYANSLEQKWSALSTLAARVFSKASAALPPEIIVAALMKTGGAPNNCTSR